MIRLAGSTALGAGLALLAACSPSPTRQPPPPPQPSRPPPAPAPAPALPAPEPEQGWRDRPLAPGTWVYRADDRGSLALYGPANSEASFLVRCELPARRIVFSRAGEVTGEATMSFTTTAGARSYQARASGGALPYLIAVTDARDGWLDELAFTRGRFAVAVSGQPLLVLPSWPEMVRVFEDCR